MPLPVIPDVYRVTLNWQTTSGLRAANVWHVRKASSSSASIASTIDANAAAGLWGQVSGTAVMNRMDVIPLDGASPTYSLATSGAKWTGGGGVGDYLLAVAEIVTFKTAFRGPANRGRMYLPFVAEAANVNGTLTGVSTTQTAWNTFFTALIAAGVIPVVASYAHASQHDITSQVVQSIEGTQRRRQNRLR